MRTAILIFLSSVAITAQSATVQINGPRSLTVSAADLAGMSRTTVVTRVNDQEATYEGVRVRDLLTRVGVPTGEALRGKELAAVVVVIGADGYRVAFNVAEFDPDFTDRIAILADRKVAPC